jgi:hypothetical protein
MLKRALLFGCMAVAGCGVGAAQEADFGVTVPVTLSAGGMDTHRFQLINPGSPSTALAFRAMVYPTVRLGKHWFGYAAIQVRKIPYFYYDAFLTDRSVTTDVIQAYLGYSLHVGKATMVFKAGQMTSAFGSFPLRYDDAENPLIDQPLNYITEIPLRTDQLSCGTNELLREHYGFVFANCGGARGGGAGLTPVTLYGLLGVEAEASAGRFDGRLQMANNSPAYPTWSITKQYLQWAAGGGFTIRQGFRVGGSAFRGPYLESSTVDGLPAGTTVRDFPATGLGVDGQWALGRYSLNGEWQRLQFDAPNFVIAPTINAGYIEGKARLTPRLYMAGRVGRLGTGRVSDIHGVSADQFAPALKSYELAAGAWLNRYTLLKVSYSWLKSEGSSSNLTNVVGFQLVTSLHPVQWAWR